MDNSKSDPGSHYRYTYSRKLKESEIESGHVTIKLDPYRIALIYQIGGGPREHIFKKALRGRDKGHNDEDMYLEIIACANRALEMIEENRN